MQTNTINFSTSNPSSIVHECTAIQRDNLAHYSDMYGVSDDGSMSRVVEHWILVKPEFKKVFLSDYSRNKLEKFGIEEIWDNTGLYDSVNGETQFVLTQYREIASTDFDLMLTDLIKELELLGAEYEYWSFWVVDKDGNGFLEVHTHGT